MIIKFKLNGKPIVVNVKPNELLINVLRDKLGVKSVKYGCGIGECGACTVLVNGEPVLSCLTLAVDVNGKEVVTVEGLAKNNLLDPVQKALLETNAIQCGFCTPGFIIMVKKLLEENPKPTIEEAKEYLRGNLCRCTGYVNILRAVKRLIHENK